MIWYDISPTTWYGSWAFYWPSLCQNGLPILAQSVGCGWIGNLVKSMSQCDPHVNLKRNQCRALSMLFYEMWVLFFPILFHCSTMFGLDVALRSSTKNQKDLGNPHSWKSCCRGKTIQISTVLLRVFTGKHQNIPVGWSSAVCSQRFWPPDREVREIVMWGFFHWMVPPGNEKHGELENFHPFF